MMERVRVQRAMVDFLIRSPKTGNLRIIRSMNTWTGTERFHSARKPTTPPITAGEKREQKFTKKEENPPTKKDGGGGGGAHAGDTPLQTPKNKKNTTPGGAEGKNAKPRRVEK